jgi:hypothetical protein
MIPNQNLNEKPSSDQIDLAWKILLNTQEMVKFADQKINVLLVIGTLLISTTLAVSDIYIHKNSFLDFCFWAIIIVSVVFFIFSLISLFSRNDEKTGKDIPKLIHFGQIIRFKEAREYQEAFVKMSDKEAITDICYQIYEVSCIANTKYFFYKLAWISLLIQLIIFLTIVLTKSFFMK